MPPPDDLLVLLAGRAGLLALGAGFFDEDGFGLASRLVWLLEFESARLIEFKDFVDRDAFVEDLRRLLSCPLSSGFRFLDALGFACGRDDDDCVRWSLCLPRVPLRLAAWFGRCGRLRGSASSQWMNSSMICCGMS